MVWWMVDFEHILHHLVAGKYYGDFVSLFCWWWLEKDDIRPYFVWDDAKLINRKMSAKSHETYVDIFSQEKDATLDVFFDVNTNWIGGYDVKNGDRIIQYFFDLIVFSLKHGIFVECFFFENETMIVNSIGKNKMKVMTFVSSLKKIIASYKKKKKYSSYGRLFLERMSESSKRRAIIIFSDFLWLENHDVALLQQLEKDHALYLFRLPLFGSWINYNDYSLSINQEINALLHFHEIQLL